MDSEIWRVRSEQVGKLQSFKSEFDMESFLMNNPAITGCVADEKSSSMPTMIRQQIHTKKEDGSGRIDLIGLRKGDQGYELLIFELKNSEVNIDAVNQLFKYLEKWQAEGSAKSIIRDWVLGLQMEGVDETNIDEIINHPRGILIGPKFTLEAINEAQKHSFQAIRLARFTGGSKHEHYIIIEDQLGDIIDSAHKTFFGWQPFLDKGIIKEDDIFYVNTKEGVQLEAVPDLDPHHIQDKHHKWLVFTDDSKTKLLEKEENIRKNWEKEVQGWQDSPDKIKRYESKVNKIIENVQNGEGLLINNAGLIAHWAYGLPGFWVPGQEWIHQRTKRRLSDLQYELKKLLQ